MKKYRPTHHVLGSSSNGEWRFGLAISRRRFLKAGVGLATLAALPIPVLARGRRELKPIEVRSYDPVTGELTTTLEVQLAENRLGPGSSTTVFTRTYEGTIPGPILRVRRGGTLGIRLINNLVGIERPLQDNNVNLPHGFNTTNLHTHGFNVSPRCEFDEDGNITKCSDNVLVEIPPRELLEDAPTFLDYEYIIPEDHADGTFWYHPHKHGSVAFQMMGGMGGAIIVEGPTDDFLERLGIKEQIFALQQLRVKEDGEVQVESFQDFVAPPLYTLNGQLKPIIRMRPGEVQRWRFIHAGMSEHIPLELRRLRKKKPQMLYQLACDGITLPQLEKVDRIFMASGNRVDTLVKIDKPGVYFLTKPEFDQGFVEGPIPEELIAKVIVSDRRTDMDDRDDGDDGDDGDEPDDGDRDLNSLTEENSLKDLGLTPLAIITDDELDDTRPAPGAPHRTLIFTLDPTSFIDPFPKFLIGGRYEFDDEGKVVLQEGGDPFLCLDPANAVSCQFDPDRVDQKIKKGAVEEWTILNFSPIDHPFHIHQVPFLVTEINDPRPNGAGRTVPNKWQDVQNIPGGTIDPETFQIIEPGSITFRIRFDGGNPDKGGIAGQFVLHCHILDHEDLGMMQLVEVIEDN